MGEPVMPKIAIPARLREFIQTEAGLFSLQCLLWVPVVSVGVAFVLPAL